MSTTKFRKFRMSKYVYENECHICEETLFGDLVSLRVAIATAIIFLMPDITSITRKTYISQRKISWTISNIVHLVDFFALFDGPVFCQ